MKWILFLCIGLLFINCQSSESVEQKEGSEVVASPVDSKDQEDDFNLDEEMAYLTTEARKTSYFKGIIQADMIDRSELIETLQQKGYSSEEYTAKSAEVKRNDENNLKRIQAYHAAFGLPNENSVGRMQTEVIALVARNTATSVVHKELYPAAHQAWKIDIMDDSAFANYLQDWYALENGNRLEMKNPYTSRDEIKALRKKLGV